jgi:hypothetical protein
VELQKIEVNGVKMEVKLKVQRKWSWRIGLWKWSGGGFLKIPYWNNYEFFPIQTNKKYLFKCFLMNSSISVFVLLFFWGSLNFFEAYFYKNFNYNNYYWIRILGIILKRLTNTSDNREIFYELFNKWLALHFCNSKSL